MSTYERTLKLERMAEPGVFRAVLATDGEASDGHVLAMKGAETPIGIPLLFGHDAHSGRSNLGSWSSFMHRTHEIVGEAAIELDGAGDQRDWRADVAHMIAAGHIGAVSVRWEPVGKPIKRTALAPKHPAYVDAERETDWAKLNGYYFPAWRALEGSVVTLGADKAALIKRSLETSGRVAELWREAAEGLARDEVEPTSDEILADEAAEDLEAAAPVERASETTQELAKVAELDLTHVLELIAPRILKLYQDAEREIELHTEQKLRAAMGR